MAATTTNPSHQDTYTCSRCGEDFAPTIRREFGVATEPETCPAGGGHGHSASVPALKAASR